MIHIQLFYNFSKQLLHQQQHPRQQQLQTTAHSGQSITGNNDDHDDNHNHDDLYDYLDIMILMMICCRSVGKVKEAEQIEAQIRQKSGGGGGGGQYPPAGGAPGQYYQPQVSEHVHV